LTHTCFVGVLTKFLKTVYFRNQFYLTLLPMNQTTQHKKIGPKSYYKTLIAVGIFLSLVLVMPFVARADGNAAITEASPANGTLTVCKMIVDQNGTIATSSANLAEGYFGLTIGTSTDIAGTSLMRDQWFARSFAPNTSLVAADQVAGIQDAQCYTHSLPLGQYYYSQENISGNIPVWTAFPVRYFDGVQSGFSIASSSAYSGVLFDADPTNDILANNVSDGLVTLDAATPNKIIVLVNGYENITDVSPQVQPVTVTTATTASPTCQANTNLIANGSFEIPTVTSQAGWDVFATTTPNIGWDAEWLSPVTSFGGMTRPTVPLLEISRVNTVNTYGVNPLDGSQMIELDGDWTGPVNHGPIGTPASIGIFQTIQTIPGDTYSLSYGFAPRAGYDATENILGVYAGATTLATISASGAGLTQTSWTTYTNTFVATSTQTRIEFKDLGTPDSFGTLLDNVNLSCVPSVAIPTNHPPVITLIGANPLTITQGTSFVDPGATAQDPQDGNITSKIITTGTVNASVVGTTTVTYSVTDNEGLSATTTREVVVVPATTGGGPSVCSIAVVSDTTNTINGGGNAVATYNANPAWTANIPGATWIWKSYLVVNPSVNDSTTFTKTFTLSSTSLADLSSASLMINADNSFIADLNGVQVGADGTEFNYYIQNEHTYNVVPNLHVGVNTLSFTVENFAAPAGTSPQLNPAGLLYKLDIETADSNCNGGPVNTPPTITLLGANPFILNQGTTFVDPGATAHDKEDGDLTSKIVESGTVNTTILGTTTLMYSVTDSGGLTASTTRTVIVVPVSGGGNPTNAYCPQGGDMTYNEFVQAQTDGLINFSLSTSTTGIATAHITNTTGCTFPVSLSSYRMFDQVLSHQVFFSGTGPINATSTTDMQVSLPSCMAQIDLWFGLAPQTLLDSNPYSGPTPPVVLAYTFIDNATNNFATASGQFCTNGPVNTPPTITLIGANPFTLNQGMPFVDPGATAHDKEDGDLTSKIIETGTVDIATPGTYTRTYTVTDSGGLTASTTRAVIVVPVNGGGGFNTGSINVCLVVERFNGTIATTSDHLAPGSVSLSLASSSLSETPMWNIPGFTVNRMLISNENDADCMTYHDVPFGTYTYSQATTTGTAYGKTLYNDGAQTPVTSLMSFFPYSSTTPDADGLITLNSMNTNQTLSVLEIATNTPPTITLIGANPLDLDTGTTYTELGATAHDLEDGDLTSKIVIDSTAVNTATPGTYTVTYSVTDSGGLTASTTRQVVVTTPSTGGGCSTNCGGNTPNADLKTTKTVDKSTANVGDTLTYTITVVDNGPDTATAVGVTDILPAGLDFVSTSTTVGSYSTTTGIWSIGDLANGASASLTLVAKVQSGTEGQTITNTAVASSTQVDNNPSNNTSTVGTTINGGSTGGGCTSNCGGGGNGCSSNCGGGGGNGPIVGSIPTGGGGNGPIVVTPPATTTTVVGNGGSCYYLYDYLHTGWNNNPVEVKKLQVFLKDLEGYPVVVTGVYDAQTVTYLDQFQVKYASDILIPWDGTSNPSGFTYILTKKKVNEIYCQTAFPLTTQQQQVIDAYRQFINDLNANGVQIVPPTPAQLNPAPVTTGEIGQATSTAGSNLAVGGPTGSTTSIISSRISEAAAAILAFPWNWMKGIVSPKACVLGNAAWCKWIDVVIGVIILILIYVLFRGPRQPQDIEEINKELDVK
jgi:uncharacterized repeat protein (TIGR01451 family)